MSAPDIERLQSIKTLPSLVAYLKHDLDWPIDADEIEDVFFEYDPEELGLASDQVAGIKEVKQLRPLNAEQPWGIFWVNFEKKRLPVVMLRRILGHLVIKKRASANKAAQRAWHANDLLFISAYGEEHERAITFAHFTQDADSASDLPVLKVLGWDGGDTVLHLADAHRTLIEKLRWPTDTENLAAWRNQWAGVFTLRLREVISTTTELVEELAKLATSIRKRADSILSRESARGPMRQLYSAFKTALIHDLSEDDFADVIAQTISYGLLAARFSSKGSISTKSLVEMIPPTNPFLRELLAELLAVAGRKKGAFDFDELGIQDVVDLLNQANAEAVKSDFGNRSKGEDPVIHFYEHFLKAYDKKKKVQRGVFFTPQPVVSYIVRSVHELLQTEFGLEDGLADTTTWGEMEKRIKALKIPDGAKPADPFVLILDPATGTATFLVEVIEVIFTHLKKKWTDLGKKPAEIAGLWNEYVPKNLLPRLYGYELMMAPYTIAHMKLALKLQEINARLGQPDFQFMYTDRAHIYLTNSLEPAGYDKQGTLEGIFPALAHEATAVNRVKRNKRFTVVIGNPPYSFRSTNKSSFIMELLEDYRKGLNEKKPQLNDDYVKFFRFGQFLLSQLPAGILGMITNNSYLYGVTHRRMRESMCETFDSVRILNLGGDVKFSSPDVADENVFDIQQGVAIGLLARHHGTSAILMHHRLHGTRAMKYSTLAVSTFQSMPFEVLSIQSPFYFTKDLVMSSEEYPKWPSLIEVFPVYVNGIVTSRDTFAVDASKARLSARVRDFVAMPYQELLAKYKHMDLRDNTAVDIRTAQRNLRKNQDAGASCVTECSFRPFDEAFIAFDSNLIHRTREEVMGHMRHDNLAMVFNRSIRGDPPHHFFVAQHVVMKELLSSKDNCYAAPLILYDDELGTLFRETGYCVNLGQRVSEWLKEIDRQRVIANEPRRFFHYAYAVFHSPTYRTRYAEFLKIDFPRLPLTSSLDLFRALAKFGGELVALHLMESPKLDKHITKWVGGKNPEVGRVAWCDDMVWIDAPACRKGAVQQPGTQGFRGVPADVWNFHIGGYQVCEKWLKDRKARKLSADDINHYHRIVVALSETIRLMKEIDEVIERHGGWPGAFQASASKEADKQPLLKAAEPRPIYGSGRGRDEE